MICFVPQMDDPMGLGDNLGIGGFDMSSSGFDDLFSANTEPVINVNTASTLATSTDAERIKQERATLEAQITRLKQQQASLPTIDVNKIFLQQMLARIS